MVRADLKVGEAMSSQVKGVIRNGPVEVAEPIDLPEGTEVVVAPEVAGDEDGPVSPDDIARVLVVMQRLESLDIPDALAADLEAWERKVNRHGIDHADSGIGAMFR